jgi:hypothetical protein
MFAAGGLQQWLVKKIYKVIGVHIRPKNNVAPFSAVPAVWPTARHKFLTPETDTAVATVTGFCVDSNAVYEHGVHHSAFGTKCMRSVLVCEGAKRGRFAYSAFTFFILPSSFCL